MARICYKTDLKLLSFLFGRLIFISSAIYSSFSDTLVVLSGVFRNRLNQSRSKEPHMWHIWHQIKEEIVVFQVKTTCDFLFWGFYWVYLGQAGKFSFNSMNCSSILQFWGVWRVKK